jgi:hypothetical protein
MTTLDNLRTRKQIKIEMALSFLDDPVKTPAGRQGQKSRL